MLLAQHAVGFFQLEYRFKDEAHQGQSIHSAGQGGELHFRQVRGSEIPFGKTGFPVRARGVRSGGVMVAGRDLPGQQLFGFHGVQFHITLFPQKNEVVAVHQLIAGAHHLAEHHFRRFIHAHVVSVGFGHLAHAVQPLQQRHRHGYLGHHALLFL